MIHTEGQALDAASGGRKAYQPPQIVSREPLEVVAAVCSGHNAKSVPGFCDANLLQS